MHGRSFIIYCLAILIVFWTSGKFCHCEDDSHHNHTITGCTPESFDDQTTCTLTCTVGHDDTISSVADVTWTYYFLDETTSVQIFDGVSIDESKTDTSLTLSQYNAGTYACNFQLVNASNKAIIDAKYSTQIGADGSALDGPCVNSTECGALNANCSDGTCQCDKNYPIQAQDNINTSACLAASSPDGPCNVNEQCSNTQYYECKDNTCWCNGTVSSDDGKTCLQAVKPNNTCSLDQECTLFDKHTACEDGLCACTGDYDALDDEQHCSHSGLTDAAIAGIAVAGVFAVGVLAIIIRCIAEKCCCKSKDKDEEEAEEAEAEVEEKKHD